MEYCQKTNERTPLKEWRYAVSLTIFISTCLYASWNIACLNRETLSETRPLTVKDVNYWSKNSRRNRTSLDNVETTSMGGIRKLLGGPGSSPPKCTSKCGRCKPCKAVHVSVPPGTPVTTEYYPEAWRCQCGNKLYMP